MGRFLHKIQSCTNYDENASWKLKIRNMSLDIHVAIPIASLAEPQFRLIHNLKTRKREHRRHVWRKGQILERIYSMWKSETTCFHESFASIPLLLAYYQISPLGLTSLIPNERVTALSYTRGAMQCCSKVVQGSEVTPPELAHSLNYLSASIKSQKEEDAAHVRSRQSLRLVLYQSRSNFPI